MVMCGNKPQPVTRRQFALQVRRSGQALLLGLGLFAGMTAAADADTAANAGDNMAAQVASEPQIPDADAPPSRWAQPRYPGARILIDARGEVFIDDEPATTALLHEAFTNLTSYNGVVWYYRENPAQEPEGAVARAVDEVIGILTRYKLGVELFESGFPDPEAHRQTLENPPPRYSKHSTTSEAGDDKR